MRSSQVVGRETELAVLGDWLDVVPDAATALLIEGEAGIGKTTILAAGVEAARARGWRVLSTAPSEAEARLALAGLADLLDGVGGEVLGELPDPQREALEVALLRRVKTGPPPEARTAGAALLGCLRVLSRSGPVIVAVDDVQWLDAATARTLTFALRRLTSEPVGPLLVRRGTSDATAPLELDRSSLPLVRLVVEPFDARRVAALLRHHLAWTPSRVATVRLQEVSGGNPLFALELGRALRGRGTPTPGEPLPVPERLQDLVRARLHGLDDEQRDVLLFAAATNRPTLDLLRRCLGREVIEAIEATEDAALIVRAGQSVRFAHPLYASVLYASAPRRQRRSLHGRLADVVTDPEERARHLALAAPGPDPAVAAALERAASTARTRGAPEAAAELTELAIALTPVEDSDVAWRRHLIAATHHMEALDSEAALRLLDAVGRGDADADVRAHALILRSLIEINDVGPEPALCSIDEALDLLGEGATVLHATAHGMRGFHLFNGLNRLDQAERELATAIDLARTHGYRGTETDYARFLLAVDLFRGRTLDTADLDRTPAPDADRRAPFWGGMLLSWSGDHVAGRAWLERARTHLETIGDEMYLGSVLMVLGDVEWRDGNWARSRECFETAMTVHGHGGQRAQMPLAIAGLAVLDAAVGRADEARARLEPWVSVAEESGFSAAIFRMRWALGFTELCAGDPAAATATLLPLWQLGEGLGFHEQGAFPFRADLIEALVDSGDLDRADAILRVESGRSPGANEPYDRMCWERCGALLSAARGDLAGALASSERALQLAADVPFAFEVARTWLVHGMLLRRRRRRRDARRALERSADVFGHLGATVWLQRAEAELDRLGLRPTASLELTPTEDRIARMVAEGLTNAAIAGALAISVRTVEANLTRIYRKMGVQRRAELVRLLTRAGR